MSLRTFRAALTSLFILSASLAASADDAAERVSRERRPAKPPRERPAAPARKPVERRELPTTIQRPVPDAQQVGTPARRAAWRSTRLGNDFAPPTRLDERRPSRPEPTLRAIPSGTKTIREPGLVRPGLPSLDRARTRRIERDQLRRDALQHITHNLRARPERTRGDHPVEHVPPRLDRLPRPIDPPRVFEPDEPPGAPPNCSGGIVAWDPIGILVPAWFEVVIQPWSIHPAGIALSGELSTEDDFVTWQLARVTGLRWWDIAAERVQGFSWYAISMRLGIKRWELDEAIAAGQSDHAEIPRDQTLSDRLAARLDLSLLPSFEVSFPIVVGRAPAEAELEDFGRSILIDRVLERSELGAYDETIARELAAETGYDAAVLCELRRVLPSWGDVAERLFISPYAFETSFGAGLPSGHQREWLVDYPPDEWIHYALGEPIAMNLR